MKTLFDPYAFDLISPDGTLIQITPQDNEKMRALIRIEDIPTKFVGFYIEENHLCFNLKSTLAQLGVECIAKAFSLNEKRRIAEIEVEFQGLDPVGCAILPLLKPGAKVGKLFAADPTRRVRHPKYLSRMFERKDRWGRPLLSLGSTKHSQNLVLKQIDGRVIAYLAIQKGRIIYENTIFGFLPTLAKALHGDYRLRDTLALHQKVAPHMPCNVKKGEVLLIKTLPLHIRTVFGKVVGDLLEEGYTHTSANILQPDTMASGDIYELYGDGKDNLKEIPLEFYTLEPHREYVFFKDRDQLQHAIENQDTLSKAFETAPKPLNLKTAIYISKGQQLLSLQEKHWIAKEIPKKQKKLNEDKADEIQRYIKNQPIFSILQAIDDDVITSEGILLMRYFPSPYTKHLLLSNQVLKHVKGIYFQYASHTYDDFFTAEDRALIADLHRFGIPLFWLDSKTGKLLKYTQKENRSSGLFVPIDRVDTFLKATLFGIYGSNLLENAFEPELKKLLQGILDLRNTVNHPLLNPKTPLALVTGGGPGAMETGNRIAKELGILSCACVVDFRDPHARVEINEQRQNPYIEAKMTYRLDRLVERQAEFNLDFPIFLTGGIGTDFEFALEEVRRKVGISPPFPVLLMGPKEFWKQKLTQRFKCNEEHGTIAGSEWLSNCFFSIQTAEQGLKIYKKFFEGTLPIGPRFPKETDGFVHI